MTDLIERSIELNRPPADVWQAITAPAWLMEWLADEVELELWPGGSARFVVDGEVRCGWVEEVRAPSTAADDADAGRLAFWWEQAEQPPSRVELELTPTERGTRLRVVETRPLEVLDLVGVPLPGHSGTRFGPALVAA